MGTKKILGIWMDHSTANLLDLNTEEKNHTITSDFNFDTEKEALKRSEDLMHNKEQQKQQAFYKELASQISTYNQVLLFGPTNAKLELKNFLEKDLKFKDIKVDVVAADKMTDKAKFIFVKNYFAN